MNTNKTGIDNKFFRVLYYRVLKEKDYSGRTQTSSSEASIKVQIKDRVVTYATPKGTKTEVLDLVVYRVAEGNGSVNALDNALRKALADFFSGIENVKLVDFEVHKKRGEEGTESLVEVTVKSSDGKNTWETKATSTDIIEASMLAIVSSLEKELLYLSASIRT